MDHTEVKHGMRLRYYPVSGRDRWYVGTVDGEPFLLGNTWCVTLRNMPTEYATCIGSEWTSRTVFGACLDNCKPDNEALAN